jgi:hypothetical protein
MSTQDTKTAQFTPGPWSVAYDEDGQLQLGGYGDVHTSVFSESGFGIIAQVLYKKSNILGDSKKLEAETFEANASLIAAAPDMYEALKEIAKGQNGELKAEFISRITKLAKAVLTKAEGGIK